MMPTRYSADEWGSHNTKMVAWSLVEVKKRRDGTERYYYYACPNGHQDRLPRFWPKLLMFCTDCDDYESQQMLGDCYRYDRKTQTVLKR